MSIETGKLSKLPSFYPCNTEKRGKKNVGRLIGLESLWQPCGMGEKGEHKKCLGHFRVVPSLCFKCEAIDMK